MFDFLTSFNLTMNQWLLVIICGLLVGTAKVGVTGTVMLAIPVLAGIFGGKHSVGLLLPMLCMGDVFAIRYYHRHAEWFHVWRLMPWSFMGILTGVAVGNVISDIQFKGILASIILISLGLMIWRDSRKVEADIPKSLWFSAITGLFSGFTTMIGNAAGPVMAIYLLSMRLPKNNYIGTKAWFFFIVNLLKVPFHIFIWHTITLKTLSFDFAILPAIALGALIGIKTVKKIPEKTYRIFIIIMTVIAALKMLL